MIALEFILMIIILSYFISTSWSLLRIGNTLDEIQKELNALRGTLHYIKETLYVIEHEIKDWEELKKSLEGEKVE